MQRLPEHAGLLQFFVCLCFPGHLFPKQDLILLFVPGPQVLVHSDHQVQGLQTPSVNEVRQDQ